MGAVETTLVVFIAGLGVIGFTAGFIQSVGSIVGAVLGAIVASRVFQGVGSFLLPFVGGNEVAAGVTGFALVFVVTSKAVGAIFYIINKAFHIIAIVPGLKLINRLAGLVLGLFEGALIVGVTLNLLARLPVGAATADAIEGSALLSSLIRLTGWVVPLFPVALREATSVLQ